MRTPLMRRPSKKQRVTTPTTENVTAQSPSAIVEKKGEKKVTFYERVRVHRLPTNSRLEAWQSRVGMWQRAPHSDEIFDGDLNQFREMELTPEEWQQKQWELTKKQYLPFWYGEEPKTKPANRSFVMTQDKLEKRRWHLEEVNLALNAEMAAAGYVRQRQRQPSAVMIQKRFAESEWDNESERRYQAVKGPDLYLETQWLDKKVQEQLNLDSRLNRGLHTIEMGLQSINERFLSPRHRR